jgi:hypothetical protein
MISSLRPFVIVAGAVVSLSLCACIYSGDTVQAASESGVPDTGSTAVARLGSQTGSAKVMIPGPLRSFLRMAGISQQAPQDDVLALLARNSYLLGYGENTQTEYLRLLNRYLHQARELQILAGPSGTITIATCNDSATLLRVLGYRLREACGQKNQVLETTNATRAFLTIDSGFPLTDLEESLQKGVPFTYSYPASWVPVLFKESDWLALSANRRGGFGSLVDVLVNDQLIARLYWALAKSDSETGASLQRAPGLSKLLPLAPAFDFYGSQIRIRGGRLVLPGAKNTEAAWKDLVGESADSPGDFITHLLAKDNGWMAAYFDSVSRISQAQQDHVIQAPRLKHLYEAFRAADPDSSATRGVFRKAPDLLVLLTRVDWEPSGEMHIPGGLEVWKQILRQKSDSKINHDLSKRVRSLENPEQLLEAMSGFSRVETDCGPLQIYLMLSELDSGRAPQKRLSPETVRLLASRYSQLSSWYLTFTEFPDLSDESIVRFMNVAEAIDKISNQALRGNVMGAFQANVGVWQILARQGEIPKTQLDASWKSMVDPFAKVSSSAQLFDVARNSLGALMFAATGKAGVSQDEIIELLAGPAQDSADGQRVHTALAGRIRSVLNDQRLVSFDTLFALSDGLSEMAQGKSANDRLLPLAGELRDFEMPRQIFSKSEKVEWAPRGNSGHHAELQVRTDLTKVIKPAGSRVQLEAARGQLAPLLRDTLVGLNYAYYEPPDAQILHINPLFVRSHDFLGVSVIGSQRLWQAPMLIGAGVSAGGGGYLMGSLADLPYALAASEEDMIAPENVQALIWKELAPELLSDAVSARWWNVTPNELHAVALYQQFAEELMSASVTSAPLRAEVMSILSDRIEPQRLDPVEMALERPDALAAFLPRMMPADLYYLGAEFQKRFPAEAVSLGQTGVQLEDLSRRYPTEVNGERLSKDFGIPHPTLAQTSARELLNVKPFPFYGAFSGRLFGERWESGNLYWARLADQMGYSPVMLNRLVPELTRHMIAKIFATDLEDWPAVLRAMRETGDDLKKGKIVLLPVASNTGPVERTIKEVNAQ